jgi:hypothetical protein
VKVWVYHGDEIPVEELETERARARAMAGMSLRGTGGASTGALITDEKDMAEVSEAETPQPDEGVAGEESEAPASGEEATGQPADEATSREDPKTEDGTGASEAGDAAPGEESS